MGTLLGILLPSLPSIIGLVEKLFGSGGGKDKAQAALNLAIQLAQLLVASGKLSKDTIIQDTGIAGALETLVQQANSKGLLNGTSTDLSELIKALLGALQPQQASAIKTIRASELIGSTIIA